VDAIQTASEVWETGEWPEGDGPRNPLFFGEQFGLKRATDAKPDGIGDSSPRYRGEDHAMGEKPYVADMSVPEMLHGAVVLSAHPRARILGLEPSAAAAEPGVVRVVTAADIPGAKRVGLIRTDWPVFVGPGDTTRCVGDVLAIVLADTQYRARLAAEVLGAGIEYEVMEPVTDPVTALKPDSAPIPKGGNLLDTCAFARGDVDAALASAAHVVQETFVTQRIEHAFLEPEACLAVPVKTAGNGSGPSLKIYTQGQGVHEDQAQIASVLGVDIEYLD